MPGEKARGRKIREFILGKVDFNAGNMVDLVTKRFGISSQAANRHLRVLAGTGAIVAAGTRKNRTYKAKPIRSEVIRYDIAEYVEEDVFWSNRIKTHFIDVPKNVYGICYYGFTEMFNNVLDHSETKTGYVSVTLTSATAELCVNDDGVGIFAKIQKHFNLQDPRHALLELSKGKLTSNPAKHSGEGIFFTSLMFDQFYLASGNLAYIRRDEDDWLIEDRANSHKGTFVSMKISLNSKREPKDVFAKYEAENDDFGFTKTHVPVDLANYPGEQLVSRSQAKRLLARFDQFKEVFLDFKGVDMVGQAFADEIFRVFKIENPAIQIIYVNANAEVEKMIQRAIGKT
jgi:hypothetical protein